MSRVPWGYKGLPDVVLIDAGVRIDGRTITIPYRSPGGAVHNRRVIDEAGQWWQTRGLSLILFGLELVPEVETRKHRQLWICEGESCTLALRGEIAEWRGLPVDTIGVPGATTWRSEWAHYLHEYAAVYLFPDGDEAGNRLAQNVTRDVPHVIRVHLPAGLDVRDVIQRDGGDRLEELIVEAETAAFAFAAFRASDTLAAFRVFCGGARW
jgi:5S rRNA maturation endonuclease (ribonuclease M5)